MNLGDKPAHPVVGMMPIGSQEVMGVYREGMTIRQIYKMVALQGIMAFNGFNEEPHLVADEAAKYADALIAEDEQHAKRGEHMKREEGKK